MAKLGRLTPGDIAAASARALRACRTVPEECREACRVAVSAVERELKELLKRELSGRRRRRIRIVPE